MKNLIPLLLSIGCLLAPARAASNPYDSYAPLVGKWAISFEGSGETVATAEFRWGRNRSYLWYAGGLILDGSESPHFEGILAYDGVRHDLDMLLEVDLGGGRAIETGTFAAQPDGSFVRDIVATYAEGSAAIGVGIVGREGYVGHFRQTFVPRGPNEMSTSVMRRAADGTYVPTFPGSDRMIMRRRSG